MVAFIIRMPVNTPHSDETINSKLYYIIEDIHDINTWERNVPKYRYHKNKDDSYL